MMAARFSGLDDSLRSTKLYLDTVFENVRMGEEDGSSSKDDTQAEEIMPCGNIECECWDKSAKDGYCSVYSYSSFKQCNDYRALTSRPD
jgi:hypothetical protein